MPLTRAQFETLVATALADNATGGITAATLRQTIAEIAAGAVWSGDKLMTVRQLAANTFDAAQAANNEIVRCLAPGRTVITLPNDTTAPLEPGFCLHAVAEGGEVEFLPANGVTLGIPRHLLAVTDGGYSLAAWKAGPNHWRVAGTMKLHPQNRFVFDKVFAIAAPSTVRPDWSGCFVTLTGSGALTVPAAFSVDAPVGARVVFALEGAGPVTFEPAVGVTLRAPAGRLARLSADGAVVHLVKLGPDVLRLWGDLEPA